MINHVFVYGTLKSNYGNNSLMRDCKFIGAGVTMDVFLMYHAGFPVVIRGEDSYYQIIGEVYRLPDNSSDRAKTLEALDYLEGEGEMFHREVQDVLIAIEDRVVNAFMYIGDDEFWDRVGLSTDDFIHSDDGYINWQRG